MELIYKGICEDRLKNDDEIIQDLTSFLSNGGDIDSVFYEINIYEGDNSLQTMLHSLIQFGKKRAVEYVLSNGANIAFESVSKFAGTYRTRYRNALDFAAHIYNCNLSIIPDTDSHNKYSIFELVKKKSLELYSEYGLTAFHIDCAIDIRFWSVEAKQYLYNAEVNATVSNESPFWPGMTPILIAAKFENENLVKRLLDLGADPEVRDSEGNTPLHYVYHYNLYNFDPESNSYDERLFAIDGKNTFGSFIIESHFHIACRVGLVHIVKRYLDQGISPDLQMQSLGYRYEKNEGKTGLHIAVEMGYVELVQLLLEYGADVDKEDSKGHDPVYNYIYVTGHRDNEDTSSYKCVFLLIEAGAKLKECQNRSFKRELLKYTSSVSIECMINLYRSITKLTVLNENLVPEILRDLNCDYNYDIILDEWYGNMHGNRDEKENILSCLKELESLPDLGLRKILDDTIALKLDFADKYKWLESFNLEAYPIYGKLLRIKFKRKLLEFQAKRRRISRAIPKMQWLLQDWGLLPNLCAENILWNLDCKELDQFLAQ